MKRIFTLLSIACLVSGCAAPAPKDEPPTPEETRLAVYQRHAGEARDEVVFPRVDGWSELPREFIAVRTVDDRYFLLTLELTCSEAFRIGSDLAIAIEQETRNTLHRFDRIQIGGQRCRVEKIQPLDAEAIHVAMGNTGINDPFIARGADRDGS